MIKRDENFSLFSDSYYVFTDILLTKLFVGVSTFAFYVLGTEFCSVLVRNVVKEEKEMEAF